LEILGLEKITVVITKNFKLPQSSKNDGSNEITTSGQTAPKCHAKNFDKVHAHLAHNTGLVSIALI
jgi:hypothetical protein